MNDRSFDVLWSKGDCARQFGQKAEAREYYRQALATVGIDLDEFIKCHDKTENRTTPLMVLSRQG